MSLVPEITISEFKKLKPEQIKEMKSVIVTSNGEHLFTAIIPPDGSGSTIMDTIKTEAEYLGNRGNTVGGKFPDEVMGKVPV
jgi:hypothetical protein